MKKDEEQQIIWQAIMEEMAIFEYTDWLNPRIGLGSTEYAESRINASVCCPSCFESVQTSSTQCPKCGFVLDVSMLETLRDNAFELAAYAWNYRKRYEKDIIKGKIHKGEAATKYCLAPPEGWLIYLASVVFAAILGGLSYDAFKKLFSKISSSFRRRFHRGIPRGRWQEDFYNYLREYLVDKSNPESPIFRAYIRGLIKGSQLRAIFDRSPDFETNLTKAIHNIRKSSNTETLELNVPDLSNIEEPSEDEIKKHLEQLVERDANKNLAMEKLQKYLSKLREKNT